MSKYIYMVLWGVMGWFLVVTMYNIIIHKNLDWQALLTGVVCGGIIILDKKINR